MINTVYRLCSPRRFEIAFGEIDLNGGVIVRPTHLSICNADQRYYQGTRDIKVLKEKLPMALIHEGVGQVIYDKNGVFKPGERVAMVPNIPCENDDFIAENYPDFIVYQMTDDEIAEFVKLGEANLEKKAAELDELGLDGTGAMEWLKAHAK